MRKLFLVSLAVLALGLALALLAREAGAQDQKAGQELTFPKGEVSEHPSDLHLGSDPYYKGGQQYQGSDQTGYKPEYDPSMQYYEETTTYKRVKEKKQKQAPQPAPATPEASPEAVGP
jgi:hypothetical protein